MINLRAIVLAVKIWLRLEQPGAKSACDEIPGGCPDDQGRPKEEPDPKEKPPAPTSPYTPPIVRPTCPPIRVYTNPPIVPSLPSLPEPPIRSLPKEINLKQKNHHVASTVKETLSGRRYGCLMHEPVQENFGIVACQDPSDFWRSGYFEELREEGLRAFLGWLLKWDEIPEEQRPSHPQLQKYSEVTGLDLFDLGDILTEKACQLSYVSISLLTRGSFNKLVSQELFIWGCQTLTALALHWGDRNVHTISNFPVVFTSYNNIFVKSFCELPELTLPTGLDDIVKLEVDVASDSTQLIVPDTGDFEFTEGKFMHIYWVIEDESKKGYSNMTQLHHPIKELWDCLDEEGNPDASKTRLLEANWSIYFEPLHRTLGYIQAKCFAVGRKHPVAKGWFINKDDAKQYFENLMKLTTLVSREKNNPIFYQYEEEDLFDDPNTKDAPDSGEVPKPINLQRKLNNAGKKLIVRKVVIGERQSNIYEPRVLVEYFSNKTLVNDR